jgi:hypothetical protein
MNGQKETAKTILQQLGGKQFIIMTGAKLLTAIEQGIAFRIPLSKGINSIKIELNPLDLYNVSFGKIQKNEYKEVKAIKDIYCDQLQDLFEETTGLFTSLYARRG